MCMKTLSSVCFGKFPIYISIYHTQCGESKKTFDMIFMFETNWTSLEKWSRQPCTITGCIFVSFIV